jgi:6,7-dimethyl-8-ribityllumazine synthase
VASQFNAQYVQGLVDHAEEELGGLVSSAAISIHRVPGSFEIPVVVRELARKKKADAIIACGVIMRGETNHAKNLSRSVTDALQRIAVDYGVPVINVVLSFDNEGQARERCLENGINRGTEAARAAVEIASAMSKLRRK